MKRVTFVNSWNPNVGFGQFFFNFFRIELVIGKILLFHFSVEPIKRGYGSITLALFGFGISLLIGK